MFYRIQNQGGDKETHDDQSSISFGIILFEMVTCLKRYFFSTKPPREYLANSLNHSRYWFQDCHEAEKKKRETFGIVPD